MKKLIILFLFLGIYSCTCNAGSGKFKFKNRTTWDIKIQYGTTKPEALGGVKYDYHTERIKAGEDGDQHDWGLWNVLLGKVYIKSPVTGLWEKIKFDGDTKITGNTVIKVKNTTNPDLFTLWLKGTLSPDIPRREFYFGKNFILKNQTSWDIKIQYEAIKPKDTGGIEFYYDTEEIKADKEGIQHNNTPWNGMIGKVHIKSPVTGTWEEVKFNSDIEITGDAVIKAENTTNPKLFKLRFKETLSPNIPRREFYFAEVEKNTAQQSTSWKPLIPSYELTDIYTSWGIDKDGELYYLPNQVEPYRKYSNETNVKFKKFGQNWVKDLKPENIDTAPEFYVIGKSGELKKHTSETETIIIEKDKPYAIWANTNQRTLKALPLGNLKIKALAYPYAIGLDGKCYKAYIQSNGTRSWNLYYRGKLIDIAYYKREPYYLPEAYLIGRKESLVALNEDGDLLQFNESLGKWATRCTLNFKKLGIAISEPSIPDASAFFTTIATNGDVYKFHDFEEYLPPNTVYSSNVSRLPRLVKIGNFKAKAMCPPFFISYDDSKQQYIYNLGLAISDKDNKVYSLRYDNLGKTIETKRTTTKVSAGSKPKPVLINTELIPLQP
jgi:hypothetical protein